MFENESYSLVLMSEDALSNADRDTQLEIMENWFRERFEDPAMRTPYESAEGGYIWIWGGPYDARDELNTKFSGIVPDNVICELAVMLDGECQEWAPNLSLGDYGNYLIDDIAQNSEYYTDFKNAILDIRTLLETEVNSSVSPVFYRMLFINTITTLETYLSDAFINTVINIPKFMRVFIETTPVFREEKVPLSETYRTFETIEKKAKAELDKTVWHRLELVKCMYRDTLNVEFPNDIGPLFMAIHNRHDFVHRNGRKKSGEKIIVTYDQVLNLLCQIEAFVQHIDKQISTFQNVATNK